MELRFEPRCDWIYTAHILPPTSGFLRAKLTRVIQERRQKQATAQSKVGPVEAWFPPLWVKRPLVPFLGSSTRSFKSIPLGWAEMSKVLTDAFPPPCFMGPLAGGQVRKGSWGRRCKALRSPGNDHRGCHLISPSPGRGHLLAPALHTCDWVLTTSP